MQTASQELTPIRTRKTAGRHSLVVRTDAGRAWAGERRQAGGATRVGHWPAGGTRTPSTESPMNCRSCRRGADQSAPSRAMVVEDSLKAAEKDLSAPSRLRQPVFKARQYSEKMDRQVADRAPGAGLQ